MINKEILNKLEGYSQTEINIMLVVLFCIDNELEVSDFSKMENEVKQLLQLGLIDKDYDANKFVLRYELTSKEEIKIDNDFVEEYRNLFVNPYTRKPYKMGGKGDLANTKKNLIKLFKKNKKITKEIVLEVTKKYIDSLNGNYTYIIQADYFLFKDGISKFLALYEEYMENGENEVNMSYIRL